MISSELYLMLNRLKTVTVNMENSSSFLEINLKSGTVIQYKIENSKRILHKIHQNEITYDLAAPVSQWINS